MSKTFAFDSKTNRRIDDNGILHVEKTNISKCAVNPYYGKEIPRFKELGLDPKTVYHLYRDADELAKAQDTFNNLPLLSEHIPVFSDAPPKDKIIGSTGSDASFDGTYLTNSLSIWEANAINLIEADAKKELSSAYLYDADMTPGEYEGTKYDGVMRNIRGNHVAVVESGRAGSDVVVADSNPFNTMENLMKLSKKGEARLKLLQAATMKPNLAADSKLLNAKKLNKAEIKKVLMAQDISPEQLDNILDAVIGVEDSPEPTEIKPEPTEMGAADDEGGSPHEKLHSFLKEKGMADDDIETAKSYFPAQAADEDEPEMIDKPAEDEDEPEMLDKPAMDAALKAQEAKLIKRFQDLEQAKADVKSVVGDLMGMDSAESVYKFALKQQGVKHDGVSDLAGLRAVFRAAKGQGLAQDSKTNVKGVRADMSARFPNLNRF